MNNKKQVWQWLERNRDILLKRNGYYGAILLFEYISKNHRFKGDRMKKK